MYKPLMRLTLTDIEYNLDVYLTYSGIKLIFKSITFNDENDVDYTVITSTELLEIIAELELLIGASNGVVH